MPSKTSLYFPRPGEGMLLAVLLFLHDARSVICTYFAHDLVVLQDSPADVDAVIVPVCPGHLLVDVGVDARHGDCSGALALFAGGL